MQTYAHLSVGLLIGQVLFPNELISQAVVVGASGIVDAPLATMFVIDKLKGKPPLREQNRAFVTINDAAHSLLLWLPSIFFWPVFLGAYSHLLIDWLSHKDGRGRFVTTDPGMLWPLSKKLRGLFDYRRGAGNLFDAYSVMVTIICLLASLVMFFK